jgi:hypothetical protein
MPYVVLPAAAVAAVAAYGLHSSFTEIRVCPVVGAIAVVVFVCVERKATVAAWLLL